MVYSVNRLPTLHGAGRVDLRAKGTRFAHHLECEFKRMNAYAIGLPHRALGIALITKLFLEFFFAEHLGLVAEDVAANPGLLFQVSHFFRAVRYVQVAAVVGIAMEFTRKRFEVFKAGSNFGVELFSRVDSPAIDPLRAR